MSKKHRQVSNQIKSIKEQSQVDIIIPVHGRFDLLTQCLTSIPDAMNDIPYKLYMIDNGSPKEEADEFYRQFQYPITIMRNKENLGFPKACNMAARRGTSPLIFFLNSDVILAPNSVNILTKDFDDATIGVAGMKLVFPPEVETAKLDQRIRPANKIQHVGLETNVRREFFHIYVGWDADHPKPNSRRQSYAVTGAAFMTRRNIWNKLRGFDEIYGAGTFDDVDFCLRVRELGYNIVVNTLACGIHYTGATAETYKLGFPLNANYLTFLQRWSNKIFQTDFVCW
jgi:O-antigen biosynthesis protein